MSTVEQRRRQLTEKYSAALGGGQALDRHRRNDVERAADLVSELELAWVSGGSVDATPEENEAFFRLGDAASEAIAKLGLPARSIEPASFEAAVDGLMSKSAGAS